MLFNALKTFPRDITFLSRVARSFLLLRSKQKNNESIGRIFDSYANKNPDKVCFYFEDDKWTYRRVQERSNRIGNYFAGEGFHKNDVVSLYMGNRPEYVCTWLGLSKAGIVPALINSNLRQHQLQHSIDIAKSKAIICGYELSPVLAELYPKGTAALPLYGTGDKNRSVFEGAKNMDTSLKKVSCEVPIMTSRREINMMDNLVYIYTSGTTGLPKTCIISHSRFMTASCAGHIMSSLNENDILYTTLPLYHSAGGMLGVGQALLFGTPVVIRKKFSAQRFWEDCIKYNVTAAQYMGETCRYLLKQPASEAERNHRVRVMLGNGLRSEIWNEFVTRFNIPKITEIYGSSEGNANLLNYTNQVGASGFIPIWLQGRYPVNVIKLNENGEPVRDSATGLVVKCQPGETGELVGKIVENHPFRDFKGYGGNVQATRKKTLSSVFEEGDSAFRTGDLFVKDDLGYYYFKDRMGDSFRWKGENVSTAQVEYIISNLAGLRDSVVFGVKIPGCDGLAGMAVISDPEGTLNVDELSEGVIKALPSFSRPLFLRLVKQMDFTGTYKMIKREYQAKGYDLEKIEDHDKIFFLENNKYVVLDRTLYKDIILERIKL